MSRPTKVEISIDTGSIVRVLLIILAVVVAYQVRAILLGILTAVVLASAVEPLVLRFSRYKFPRLLSVSLIYVAVGIFLGVLFYFFIPVFVSEMTRFVVSLPEYANSVELLPGNGISDQAVKLGDVMGSMTTSLTNLTGNALGAISNIFGGIFSILVVVTISFYLAIQKDGVADFLRLVTPLKRTDYVVNVWRRSQLKIGLWMQGQIVSGLMTAVLTYLGLSILSVPYPLMFAVIGGVFELVPIFGPLIAAVPAVAISLAEGGFGYALAVGLFYIVMQQVQSNVLYPLVVKQVIGISPLVVIIAIAIGASLGGLLGIILSVPAAAVVVELLSDFRDGKRRHDEELKALEAQIMNQ